jgi:hypothetical protein
MIYETNKLITEEDLVLNPDTIFVIGGGTLHDNDNLYREDTGYDQNVTIHPNLISLRVNYNYRYRPELHTHSYTNKLNFIFEKLSKLKEKNPIVFCTNEHYKEKITDFEEIKNEFIVSFHNNMIDEYNFNNTHEILNIPVKRLNISQNKCIMRIFKHKEIFETSTKLNSFEPLLNLNLPHIPKPVMDIVQNDFFSFDKHMYISLSLIEYQNNTYQYKANGLVYKFDNETDEILYKLKNT